MDPYAELLIFDAVQAFSSTKLASECLGLPQSSVSRRYRAFAQAHKLDLKQKQGIYQANIGNIYLDKFRSVAQCYRLINHQNRWAAHPALESWLKEKDLPGVHLANPSKALSITIKDWQGFMEQKVIDLLLLCELQKTQQKLEADELNLGLSLYLEEDSGDISDQQSPIYGEFNQVPGLMAAINSIPLDNITRFSRKHTYKLGISDQSSSITQILLPIKLKAFWQYNNLDIECVPKQSLTYFAINFNHRALDNRH